MCWEIWNWQIEKKIEIDAFALESIDFCDCATQEYDPAGGLPSLIKPKLHVSNYFSAFRDDESFEICLVKLLQKVCKVKFLLLSSHTMLVRF